MENGVKGLIVCAGVVVMLASNLIIDRVTISSKGYNHISTNISNEDGRVSLASEDFSLAILETGQYISDNKKFIVIVKKVSDFYYYYDMKSGDLIYTTNPDCDSNSTYVKNISRLEIELENYASLNNSITYDDLIMLNDSLSNNHR